MKKTNRYDTASLIEAQFEPDSRGRVLRNKLGIKSKREMDKLKRQEQLRVVEKLTDVYDRNYRFTAADSRTQIDFSFFSIDFESLGYFVSTPSTAVEDDTD